MVMPASASFSFGGEGWPFPFFPEEGREITVFRTERGETCILSAACVLQSLEFESQITAEVNSDISILPAPTLSPYERQP